MTTKPVIVAGAGIGGLAVGLTLQQIGVPCVIYESVAALQPLGLGINLQPNAVRELYELGLDESALDRVGIQTREWALVSQNGEDLYTEPRGLEAGYRWPQYSVHRGRLQLLLYRTFVDRAGANRIHLGRRVTGYRNRASGVAVQLRSTDGIVHEVEGSLLIGADGMHSAIRAKMYPRQPPVHWGGAIMWRGSSRARPTRTGASFVGLGTHNQRLVYYPISRPDPESGLAEINWIAEITADNSGGLQGGDWNREADIKNVVAHFANWQFEWLDVPALLRGAARVYEYPMTDRDPIPSWQDDRVALLGDAAHVMYPVGSNGASQAIVDARVLGACLLEKGISASALRAYDERLCAPVSALVLRNRGAGPFGLLNLIDERCAGDLDKLEERVPAAEREAFMADYKAAAGFDRDSLNAAAPTISPGSRIRPD